MVMIIVSVLFGMDKRDGWWRFMETWTAIVNPTPTVRTTVEGIKYFSWALAVTVSKNKNWKCMRPEHVLQLTAMLSPIHGVFVCCSTPVGLGSSTENI